MTTNFYIIPGIYDLVDDARSWDFQAQAWFHDRFPGPPQAICDGFNYSDDIIGGNIWLGSQAAKIAEDLVKSRKNGNRIVIVGHSNGCRLALKALELAPEVDGVTLHLLAAACDEDCDKNGLNRAVEGTGGAGQLTAVTLYVSAVDEVLGLGPLVSYGRLGKVGPTWASEELSKIMKRVDRRCAHCDWVSKDFQSTMELIAAAEAADSTGTSPRSSAPSSAATPPEGGTPNTTEVA